MPSVGGTRSMGCWDESKKEYATSRADGDFVKVGTVGDGGWEGHEVTLTPSRARKLARMIEKSADIAERNAKE